MQRRLRTAIGRMNVFVFGFVSRKVVSIQARHFMKKSLIVVLFGAAGALCFFAVQAAEKEKQKPSVDVSKIPPASDKQGLTYATDIKPIFDKSCVKCHGG